MMKVLTLLLPFLYVLSITKAEDMKEVECPTGGIAWLPHPDCTKYYWCENGHALEMLCPDGTYFNIRIRACDFIANVPECVGGTRPPESTTVSPITEGTTISPTSNGTTNIPITNATTVGTTTNTTPGPSTSESPPDGILRNCGDTIFASEGVIEYRLGQNYSTDEICSFVIRLEKAENILFTLEDNGIAEDPAIITGALNIFTFGNAGLIDSIHLGPPNPLTQVYVSGSIAVVLFRTEKIIGTGFRLKFEGVSEMSYSKYGNDTVYSELQGQRLFPEKSDGDIKGTLNVKIFTAEHKKVTPSFYLMRLEINNAKMYLCGDPMICGCDAVRIFEFDKGTLSSEELFCEPHYHTGLFETTGLFIALIRVHLDVYPRTLTFDWYTDCLVCNG